MPRRKGKIRAVDLPERRDPGDPEPLPCAPGSIEQQLDMCERGELRGDDVLFTHGLELPGTESTEGVPADEMIERFESNMSEADREGDEMSGDDHSSGLQGGESEFDEQTHIDDGIPGDRTLRHERIARKARNEGYGGLG